MGLSEAWPPCQAVGSPPSLATTECAASWHVVEKRKTMYQIAPRTRKSGVISAFRLDGARAFRKCGNHSRYFPLYSFLPRASSPPGAVLDSRCARGGQ